MRSRAVAGGYLVRLDRGEEVIETLTSFAARRKIGCGFLQGIGAVENAEIGYFDLAKKKYRRRTIASVAEAVGLNGNISLLDGKPFIHAHIILAGPDQKVAGGHLFSANVAITLEIYVRVIRGRLIRKHDPKTGFNFWQP
ncbi:MAG: DNA-binding protein [candidate division Zixibacteria bacterium]|nr:DNA-binding protein [candidate division Zixibacteria bacterium]